MLPQRRKMDQFPLELMICKQVLLVNNYLHKYKINIVNIRVLLEIYTKNVLKLNDKAALYCLFL